ncbi:hypothetical protein N0477_28855, partial [Pseudomonas aeruginosa]|nr:hypothetical protein [Pseudomonas aeruginosa]
MGTIKEWIVGAVLALLASALLVSMGYLAGRASMLREYGELAGQVRQQREQADAKLAELTAQRDMKQAALNKAAADQERKDNDAQAEIARLAGELRDRPVRVRIVPAAGGGCSGGAASAYGLLPEENSRRFNDSLSEVET